MKKYFVLFGILAMVPLCVQAEVASTDIIDPVFIKNQGYSNEVSRLINYRAKDQLTPVAVKEKETTWGGIRKKILYTIDPTVDSSNFGEHNIEFKNMTVEDL